jgi:hypothetical protein
MRELLEVIRDINSLALLTSSEDFLEGVADSIRRTFSYTACYIHVAEKDKKMWLNTRGGEIRP